jgi:hypothetical protein
VKCAVHTDTATEVTCAECGKGICEACPAYLADGRTLCAICGAREEARSRSLGFALFVLTGVGYLTTIAVCVVLMKPRAFIGGLAAVVAIGVGRALQLALRLPVVVPRPPAR